MVLLSKTKYCQQIRHDEEIETMELLGLGGRERALETLIS